MKLGIIGTGKIIEDALFAIEPVAQIELKAIFARPHSGQKAHDFAARYAIAQVFTDYDELLEQADVDTVYIGLVNSVHYEYAKKALLKGKNVILEKPFAGTYGEAAELISLARSRKLFVFEAITVLHNEVIKKMRQALPKLGAIKMFFANYSQYSSRYDRYLCGDVDHSFDPAFLGGALRDINVYNIHYAVALFGEPKKARYFPNLGFNGIDTSGALVMEYDGFCAVCAGAKDSDSPCFVSVQGEKGFMKIDGKPNVAPNLTTVIVDEAGGTVKDTAGALVRATKTERFEPPKVHHRMTQEFIDFADIIDKKDFSAAEALYEQTLGVMKVICDSEGFEMPNAQLS